MSDLYEKLQDIKNNPKYYLGKPSLKRLVCFINGYTYRQYELDMYEPGCLKGFQEYVQKKYGYPYDGISPMHWQRFISTYSNSDKEAFYLFLSN